MNPIWSVIIRLIKKSDGRAAAVQFVYHEEVFINYKFRETKNSQLMKERENLNKRLTKEA